jgi:hypothetical protein
MLHKADICKAMADAYEIISNARNKEYCRQKPNQRTMEALDHAQEYIRLEWQAWRQAEEF